MNDKIVPPEPGKTSVRFGPSFLRPAKDKGHYELMRPIITVINSGDKITTEQHGDPIGPLAIYRLKGRGDKVDMTNVDLAGPAPELKTSDPKTGKPMELILVWWAGSK